MKSSQAGASLVAYGIVLIAIIIAVLNFKTLSIEVGDVFCDVSAAFNSNNPARAWSRENQNYQIIDTTSGPQACCLDENITVYIQQCIQLAQLFGLEPDCPLQEEDCG